MFLKMKLLYIEKRIFHRVELRGQTEWHLQRMAFSNWSVVCQGYKLLSVSRAQPNLQLSIIFRINWNNWHSLQRLIAKEK